MRTGLLQLNCAECTAEDKKTIGCTDNTDTCFYTFDGDDYYTCPSKFITKGSIDFIKRYDSVKCGMSISSTYDKNLHIWNEAVVTYEHFLNLCQAEKRQVNSVNLDSFR